MKTTILKALSLLAIVAAPAVADAATRGFATANVNMRSGPSTAYPAVVVVPNGAPVAIHGCLQDRNWCDVSFNRGRGWVSGTYVQADYQSDRVLIEPRRYRQLGVPIITFEVGRYWDQHYRGRDFYGQRERWRRPSSGGYWDAPPPRRDFDSRWERPGYDRRDDVEMDRRRYEMQDKRYRPDRRDEPRRWERERELRQGERLFP